MTIITGLICKEGIVIASDSQAGSFKGVHVKRLDYTKIYDFKVNGTSIVATGSGDTPFITRAIEILEDKTKEGKFHKPREVADVAESVMNEVSKRYIFDRGKELGFSKSPSNPILPQLQEERTLGFALMLGVCCEEKTAIYTVYPDGVAEKAEEYASLGSGSAFAEYLLPRLYREDLTLDEATRVCVYVVEEVKKVDVHCGGPTQAVALGCTRGVSRKTEKEMRTILEDIKQADDAAKEVWQVISKGTQPDVNQDKQHKK
jgi:20S proteasome alpha/beta subunit